MVNTRMLPAPVNVRGRMVQRPQPGGITLPTRVPRPPRDVVRNTVIVRAAKENVHKYVFHPAGIIRFGSDGTAEWPNDQFTRRRVRDGDITVEAPPIREKAKEAQPARRQQSPPASSGASGGSS